MYVLLHVTLFKSCPRHFSSLSLIAFKSIYVTTLVFLKLSKPLLF